MEDRTDVDEPSDELGEILITETARAAAGLATDGLEPRHLELKGRGEPVDAWLMRVGARVAV